MPTNASAEYSIAEMQYRKAVTTEEKIAALENMLSTGPTHKGAENLRQDIKTKLAKLKLQLKKESRQKATAKSIAIKKEGAAQIVMVGPPNSGKSLLLNKLTGTKAEVQNYPFTTMMPEIGMLDYSNVKIQVVELPAVVRDSSVRGKGPQFFSIVRNADLILIVTDTAELEELFEEFRKSQIKLNEHRPPIRIKREGKGIEFVGQDLITADVEQIRRIIRNNGIHNALVEVFERSGINEFVDAVNESLIYLPAFIVLTKGDLEPAKMNYAQLRKKYPRFNVIAVNSLLEKNLESVKDNIWKSLDLIRIYTKEPGRGAKKSEPLTLKKGDSIKHMAEKIHKDFIRKFKFARIWGKSAKYPGITVGLEHKLIDEDIVEIHIR
jgi:ribosome-interacting GTPase 1